MEKKRCPSCGNLVYELGPNSGVCRTCHQAMCHKVTPEQWRRMQGYINRRIGEGYSYLSALRRIKAIVNGEADPPSLSKQPLVIPESQKISEFDSEKDIDRKFGLDVDEALITLDELGALPGEKTPFDVIREHTEEYE